MYEQAKTRFCPAEADAFEAVLGHEFRQLVRLDPPDHPRQRNTVRSPFTPRALANEMADKVRYRIDSGLEAVRQEGEIVDFKRFSYTLPFQVIGDLLGISLTDLDTVHGWARSIADNKFNADSGDMALAAGEGYTKLLAYIDDLVQRQRDSGNPTGLVAALIEAVNIGHIAPEETNALLGLMVFAGHETTSGLLTTGMLELLRHPDQWAMLCADPSLAATAVEELLRFVTPVQFLPYTVVGDRELDDLEVKDGDTVIGVIAAANRDPDVFERPDELDILRPDTKHHLGFGLGPHFCLGAGLARMEATQLFRTLAEQFPDAKLADGPIRWGGRSLRTPLALPIKLGG
jgi:cytochrome P450